MQYCYHVAALLFVWFCCIAEPVNSEDYFEEECSDSFFGLVNCLLANGLDVSNIVADECGACMAESNERDTTKFSCDELIRHVTGSMATCQAECDLPGCTTELTAMMTCATVKSSQCGLYTSTPTTLSPTQSPTLQPTIQLPSDIPSAVPSSFPTVVTAILDLSTTITTPTDPHNNSPTESSSSATASQFGLFLSLLQQTTATQLPSDVPSDAPSTFPSYSGLRKNTGGASSSTGTLGLLLAFLPGVGSEPALVNP